MGRNVKVSPFLFGRIKKLLYICYISIKHMLVRLESIRKSKYVLVIDELGKYLGSIEELEFFMECTNVKLEPIEEDDYIFFHVDKDCLFKILKK